MKLKMKCLYFRMLVAYRYIKKKIIKKNKISKVGVKMLEKLFKTYIYQYCLFNILVGICWSLLFT